MSIQCWACKDDGFIVYNDKENRPWVAHCNCPNSADYMYHGNKYYIPAAGEIFDLEQLAEENMGKRAEHSA